MDPYLAHPVLWEGVHARLVVAIANQLQPRLDPRYITSIVERVFIESPQRRVPDVRIQKDLDGGEALAIVEVEDLEIHQKRIEILDAYNAMNLVALIEVVSPTNKATGPGRVSYQQKQQDVFAGNCHLIEIDLISGGRHVLSVQEWRVEPLKPFDSLCCVSRWPWRNRFELYPCRLRQRLRRLHIPLADGDPDVMLDLQAALEQIYLEGRYARRIRYDRPCDPPLAPDDQAWASECIAAFRAARPDPFPQE